MSRLGNASMVIGVLSSDFGGESLDWMTAVMDLINWSLNRTLSWFDAMWQKYEDRASIIIWGLHSTTSLTNDILSDGTN